LVAFGLVAAGGLGGASTPLVAQVAGPSSKALEVRVVAWKPQPFAALVLADPDLAACLARAPGVWSKLSTPTSLPEAEALGRSLPQHLRGLLPEGALQPLTVVAGATERTVSAAVVHGSTALLLLPKSEVVGIGEVAGVLAGALLAAHLAVAPPDSRCSEPLLVLGEALARSGALTLATLPPELRPVKEWIDEDEASTVLTSVVRATLEGEVAWSTRRARIVSVGQPGGTNVQIAHAAAFLVEAYGDAPSALRRPFDFLSAWAAAKGKGFPKPRGVLKSAVAKPLDAGMPGKKLGEDRFIISNQALERAIVAGDGAQAALVGGAPLPLRLLAAARARREGAAGMCEWLTDGPLPNPFRTGCRSEHEDGGIVFSRPRAGGAGFEIVWRGPSGDEGALLKWPEWVLFPVVVASRDELWFVDPSGIWRVQLDGREAPTRMLDGAFRRLAVSPDGKHLVTTRWPDGRVLAVNVTGGSRELDGVGTGGVAWLDVDVVIASNGSKLALLALSGGKRDSVAVADCTAAITARGSVVFVATSAPCTVGIVKVDLTSGESTGLVRLTEGAAGMALFPDASLVFSAVDGLWWWHGEKGADRLTAGLTPGPG
jgi:hypothetical protein